MAIFTTTEADGLITSPTNSFSPVTSDPANNLTLVKGNGPFTVHGLIGLNVEQANFYIKENGQPLTEDAKWSWADQDHKLQGKTIYGFKISWGSFPYYTSTTNLSAYCIDFQTGYEYKLTQNANETIFGNSGIQLTPGFYSASCNGESGGPNISAPHSGATFKFVPICFSHKPGDYETFSIQAVTTVDGSWMPCTVRIPSKNTVIDQFTDEQAVLLSQGRIVDVSNTDVAVQSLEDRVDILEAAVSKFPTDIDTAFALAVDKVSKIFVSR